MLMSLGRVPSDALALISASFGMSLSKEVIGCTDSMA